MEQTEMAPNYQQTPIIKLKMHQLEELISLDMSFGEKEKQQKDSGEGGGDNANIGKFWDIKLNWVYCPLTSDVAEKALD